jgi:triosephosphate isomerase
MRNIIAANWKMNMFFADIDLFFSKLDSYYNSIDFSYKDVYIAPSFLYFSYVKEKVLNNRYNIQVGLQNCHYEDKGAFTGEVSPEMAKDVNADFIIMGHSERRHVFNESNEFINKKIIACLNKGIQTILCVGETLEQRNENKTFSVLENQLIECLKNINELGNLIIAYEPVWAIGTGKTATGEQIEEVHNWLRKFLEKNIANNIPLLYGGSVKPENIKNIMTIENVNGVLVGGASLNIEQFIKIINFDKE